MINKRHSSELGKLSQEAFESALARLNLRKTNIKYDLLLALRLMYATKLRPSVLFGLSKEDIEFKGKLWLILSVPQWGFRSAQQLKVKVSPEFQNELAVRFYLFGWFPELLKLKNPSRVLCRVSKRILTIPPRL